MHLLTVIGARPQFIKAAVVSHAVAELAAQGMDVRETLIHTGQHYDANMSEVFFRELGIPAPKHHLGIGGGGHGAMTGRMLEQVEAVLMQENPDRVLVYGDTNSTLAGALAAAKLHIPVAHVEAGLRSFNRRMPEEINRILTDHLADLLFAPTEAAVTNLRNEGCAPSAIRRTGDVMLDASLHFAARAGDGVLARVGLSAGRYVLATIHRAENTDDPSRLRTILEGFALVARQMPLVLPLHPRTRGAIAHLGLDGLLASLRVTDPLGYLDMVALERSAAAVVTDSGGVQKEAYFFRVPCVTLRDETEWVELVEHGWNRLCQPTSAAAIAATLHAAIGSHGQDVALYGDGTSAIGIARTLVGRSTNAP